MVRPGTEFGRLAHALEAFPGDGTQHEAIVDALKHPNWLVQISLMDDAAHDEQDWHDVYEYKSHKTNLKGVVNHMYRIGGHRWVGADRIMGTRMFDESGNENSYTQ